jgi:flavin-dependent dehydrogenase
VNAFDALVIGAGPAGSTAALLLARRGCKVAVVERSPFPRRKVCGEFISATSWPILRELGIADELARAAGPAIRRVGLFARDVVVDAPMPQIKGSDSFIHSCDDLPSRMKESDPFIWGRAVGRETLDTALLDHAARHGATVLQPFAVSGIEKDGDEFVARVERRPALRARIVIAAHGSWERGTLPSQFARLPARAGDLLGFKAHYSDSRLPAELMPLVLFPGGYGGMVHSGGGRVSFSCCIRRDALAKCRRERPGLNAGEAVIAHIAVSCRGVREALDGARLEGPWLSAGPIRPGTRQLQRPGYYVVGNAAGEAHPLIAEGISMAIQSAWLLDEQLAGKSERYARAWRRNFSSRIRASSTFAALTMLAPADAASVALLRRVPAILTWGARWSGKAHTLAAEESPA